MSEHDERRWPRPAPRRALHIALRGLLVVLALLLVVVFGVALWIDPYKDGRVWLEGTHRQLNLPECTFKALAGYPCPSCGMTSSFALAIRGDLWHAAQANFVGMLLALFCLAFIPWAVASSLKGRLLGIRNFEGTLVRLVIGFMVLLLVRWGLVLALLAAER